MAKPLKVLFVASEVEPFAKTGGLADVSGALPHRLKHIGQDVRIMMPGYASIDTTNLMLANVLQQFPIQVGTRSFDLGVVSTSLSANSALLPVYFLSNGDLFGRPGLYVDPVSAQDYPDNDARFIFFSRSVIEAVKQLNWQPDIIHCNDWQTGLIPVYLKTIYSNDPFFRGTRTIFTIHNMAYQGVFPLSSFSKTLLSPALCSEQGIQAHGSLNLLKAGLMFSDAITTVSRRYAQEIRSSAEFGCGLEGVVRARGHAVHGILNGIDYTVWNPATDGLIPQKYGPENLDLKVKNKVALLERMRLPFDARVPVIGIVSRLADQKGFDLIGAALPELMSHDLQLVVLGTGEKRYHDMLATATRMFPGKIAVELGFNNTLAHWIEAGSDMFLMPSRYEPCGLNQLYSLKYGTVPIVRATGGLDDSIEDYDDAARTGTGFKFSRYDPGELLHAVRRALAAYARRTDWQTIMLNGMAKDFSWDVSAQKYLDLYRSVVGT